MALHLIVIPLHSMATSEPCLSKNLSFSPSSPVSQHLIKPDPVPSSCDLGDTNFQYPEVHWYPDPPAPNF